MPLSNGLTCGSMSFAVMVLIVLSGNAFAAPGVRVVDGDTLEVSGVTYRLHGIDAPEAGQTCKSIRGGNWPCGKQAVAALEDLVSTGQVACDDRGQDDYGRTIAVCLSAGEDINAAMISSGMAWAFRKYALDYADLEDAARAGGLGVWQAETTTPWDFRAEKWEVAEQKAPNGCPIKGNISGNGRIYHAPWSPWYAKTKVSEDQGERWFCSEADAVRAGWRAPYWGN